MLPWWNLSNHTMYAFLPKFSYQLHASVYPIPWLFTSTPGNKVPKISGLSKKFCSKKRKNYLRTYCVNTKLHMYKTVLSLSV